LGIAPNSFSLFGFFDDETEYSGSNPENAGSPGNGTTAPTLNGGEIIGNQDGSLDSPEPIFTTTSFVPFGLSSGGGEGLSGGSGSQGDGGAGILFTGTAGQTLRVSNTGSILGGNGTAGGAGIQIDGGTAELVNQAGGLISSSSVAIRSTSPEGGVQVFNYGTITAPVTAISFNGSVGAANSVTLYGGSTTTGALEFNNLSGGETLTFDGSFSGNFSNTLIGLNVIGARGNSKVTMNSVSGYALVNGTANVDATSTLTIAGILLDQVGPKPATSLSKIGGGVLSLTGNNTYTGGTSVQNGTLWVKSPRALGDGNVSLQGGKLLVTSTQEPGMNGNLRIGGDVNWSNGVIAFYDTGTSPRSGNLTINVAGNFSVSTPGNATFDFSEVEALDYGDYTLVNATLLSGGKSFAAVHGQYTTLFGNFSTPANTIVYSVTGATSGGPNIENNGGPNTPVIADYDVTMPTQTIGENNKVNSLNFSNSAPLTIQSNGNLIVTSGTLNVQGGSSEVSGGTLNTPGNLDKTGAGELDLQNNTNVTGVATVAQGLLSVNGNLTANSVVVDPNATLGGTGTLFAANVIVNGNYSPGNSPGTQITVGNLVLTGANSTIIEIASPTNFDRIVVSGQASLGGTLNAVGFGGYSIAPGTRYDFLQAGSIVGEFDSIMVPDGLRGRFLNSGTVGTLLFGPGSYVMMAINQNQRNVAKALDSFILAKSGDRETVSIALDSLSTAQFPAAFDQIMPGFYESLGNIAIEQTYNQTQLLTQRLGTLRLGAVGFQSLGLSQPIKYDKDGKSVADAKSASPIVESAVSTNWNAWFMANGEFSTSRGLTGVPNYNNNAGGFLVGADYRWSENFATGVFAGYEYSLAKYNGGSSTQGNSALFGLYGSYTNENGYYADAIVSGGYTGFQTRRSIEFPGIDRTARANPNSGQFSAALNLGKDFEIGKFTLGPILGAQYTYAGIGSFTETGAESLDLALGQQNANSLRTNLGARLAYNWEVSESLVLIPEVRGFWMHEFLNNPRNINSALDGGSGPSFDYGTEDPYRNSVFAGVGVSAKIGDRWTASTFYNVNFGADGYTNNIISASFSISF